MELETHVVFLVLLVLLNSSIKAAFAEDNEVRLIIIVIMLQLIFFYCAQNASTPTNEQLWIKLQKMDAKLEQSQAELEVTKAELNVTKSALEAMNVSLIQHHEVQYNGYLSPQRLYCKSN